MTNYYKYKNTSLSNLISDITASNVSNFTGITNGINVSNVTNIKTMENPAPLKYENNGTDISTFARAKYIEYSSTQTDIEVDTTNYTHFTAYVRGGSGGGGGAGGDAQTNGGSNVSASASVGGRGGSAGYVALYENIPLNSNKIYITIGNKGTGGPRGNNTSTNGRDGGDGGTGNDGGTSYIKLGTTVEAATSIATAKGGSKGLGGLGANSGGGNGGAGENGSTIAGSIFYANYAAITTHSITYPDITLTGGIGGDNNQSTTQGSVGSDGVYGYVRIYLKKI